MNIGFIRPTDEKAAAHRTKAFILRRIFHQRAGFNRNLCDLDLIRQGTAAGVPSLAIPSPNAARLTKNDGLRITSFFVSTHVSENAGKSVSLRGRLLVLFAGGADGLFCWQHCPVTACFIEPSQPDGSAERTVDGFRHFSKCHRITPFSAALVSALC